MLQDGKTAYERAFGWSDKEANRRMAVDTILPHRVANEGDHERGHHGEMREGRHAFG